MKTLNVEDIYIGGYETFAGVVARLLMFIEQVYNANARTPHSPNGNFGCSNWRRRLCLLEL